MLRAIVVVLLGAAGAFWVGCGPSSRAESRQSVIPTPSVFEDDEGTDRIAVRAIWVAYTGAKGAPSTVTRSLEEARDRVEMVASIAQMAGESFPELERKYSDHAPLVDGGGSGAVLERGGMLLPEAAKAAAFRLAVGEVSPAVQTDEGFIVVLRTEFPRAKR